MNNSRRTAQLRAAIHHALTTALDCDVEDPALDGVYLEDVLVEPGGTFAALFATPSITEVEIVQTKLREAAPVFRMALANSLMRKRVPQVTFHVIPVAIAYSLPSSPADAP